MIKRASLRGKTLYRSATRFSLAFCIFSVLFRCGSVFGCGLVYMGRKKPVLVNKSD